MTTRGDTRTKILKSAKNLLQSHGFQALSYADLAEELGIRKASIHHHFRTKEDLILELLAEYDAHLLIQLNSLSSAPDATARSCILGFLKTMGEICQGESMICPAGVLLTEWNMLSPRVRETFLETLNRQHAWLSAVLKKGRKAGELKFGGDAEVQADWLLVTLQGALKLARVHHDRDKFRRITALALAQLGLQVHH